MSRPSSEEIARTCGGEKRTSNGYDCRCPAHEDKTASLSVNDSGIFHCHAGCTFDDVAAALKARGISLSNGNGLPPQKVIYYTYSDENGKPLFRKCRQLPKKFWVEHYQDGAWIKGIGKSKRVLYHLPALRTAISKGERVAICEGEKDANRIVEETGGQIVATCNIVLQWLPEYTAEFKGADVTVFYDNDEPGRERKDTLVAALRGVARKLTVINLPEQYKDVSDFWDAAQDITDDMREEIHIPSLGDFAKDAATWLDEPIVEPDQLLAGVINAADKVAIIGKSKTRKSFLATQLLLCLASGTDFLGFRVERPRKCLLIQFEIKEANFHARLVRMADALQLLPYKLSDNLKIISARGKVIDDSKIIDYARRESFEVILFDPLYKMIEGDESKIEVLKPVLARFDKLAEETGAAIVYVHHDKKGAAGDQDASDRGAGSGVLGRDYDAALLLTPHKDKTLVGLETVARNHAPTAGQSIEWVAGCFVQSDTPLQVQTARGAVADRNKTVIEDWIEPALGLLAEKPLPVSVFLKRLYEMRCDTRSCRVVKDFLVDQGRIEEIKILQKKGGPKLILKLIP